MCGLRTFERGFIRFDMKHNMFLPYYEGVMCCVSCCFYLQPEGMLRKTVFLVLL